MASRNGKITIEKPYGGWATDFSSSNSSAVEGAADEYSKSATVSLMQPGKEGHISPGFVFDNIADPSSKVTGQPLNGVLASNGNAFVILDNARIVNFVPGTDSVSATTNDVTFGGTGHGGHSAAAVSTNADIWKHVNGSGAERIFYSWEDNADADVGVIDNAAGSQVDNFFTSKGSAVMTKGVPHKGCVGRDNVSYVTNGRYLANYSPLKDVANDKALDLGFGWTTTSVCPFNDYVAIIGYQNTATTFGESIVRVWFWDGSSPGFNFAYDISDNYSSAIFNDAGVLKAFTQGKNNTSKVWAFNGGFDTDPIFESAQSGAIPMHGSVCRWLNYLAYGNDSGRILALGSPNKRKFKSGFHYIAAETNIGMVKNLSSNVLYIGDKSGSTYKIKKVNFSKYAVSSTFRSVLYPLPNRAQINMVKFYFSQFGTGASMTAAIFSDYNGTSVGGAADLLNTTLTNAALGPVAYYPIRKTITDLNAFYLFLLFNHSNATDVAAVLRKVEIEYSYEINDN